jgi:transposase
MQRRRVCDRGAGGRSAPRLRLAGGDHGLGLRAENERLLAENARLREQLEAARRAGKRQSAPFSKGDPKPNPARSGRKSGEQYGAKGHRPVPDHVDEEIGVPLPDCCPGCRGELEFEDEVVQYQEELVWVRGHVRAYRIARGRCQRCGRRAQGRHPSQTSDAVGAAGSQVGPGALALAAELNKELGIAMGKVSQILALLGVKITPGGLYHALGRLARAAEPTYQALALAVRQSSAVAPDETGWRVGGRRQWLWVFVGDDGVTVYLIAAGRGYEQAKSVLGEDFSGVLERDGWAPYRRFTCARHQSCQAHLLRRAGELIADSVAGQAKIPHALRRLILEALSVRDSYQDLLARRHQDDPEVIESTCVEIADEQPQLLAASAQDSPDRDDRDEEMIAAGPHRRAELDREVARLQSELDRLIARTPTHAPNKRLLAHLFNEREHLLTFLKVSGVQATNWRAEQAIRPAVVNRKSWGGNRTDHGAQVQQTLMSVIRTSRQQGICPIALLTDLQLQTAPAPSPMLRLPATNTPDVIDAADARSP